MGCRYPINRNWRFHLGDVPDADFMGYDDSGWQVVTLPHDWAVEHPFDRAWASGTGYLPGGTAWYRKRFLLPAEAAGKRIRLSFQGVYKHAKVWINSNYLGSHAYGYTSFSYDISEFLHPEENVIAVRVEHEEPADSRWYTGSGIDRPVTLEILDPVCFEENGIFVSTLYADEERAELRIRYRMATEAEETAQARFTLLDADGQNAAQTRSDGAEGEALLKVAKPRRWCPENPALYLLKAETLADGKTADTEYLQVGIRTFRFDPEAGFFLNGQNMKIRGVCVHHDAGCLGAAVPAQVWERRLLRFKAAGCNALRTAHNPPDPALLDLCDRLGFLVMDEAFDEWEGTKNKWWQGHNVYPPKHFGYAEDFPLWHERDLASMVLRDRNHPAIILWSIGNEIDYPNDPYVTPLFREALGNNDANKPLAERLYDVRKPDAGRLAKGARELTAIVHGLDDTRPVTSALSFPELSNRTGFSDALDVSGYNYREHFYEKDHQQDPNRVILGSENSHAPEAWFPVKRLPYISAQFLWTGIDFLGECRGWPVRISQAGMLNLAGFEKPLFYQRKALWTEKPMVKLAVSDPATSEKTGTWTDRFRWQGLEGERRLVSVYTNAEDAELFLNGRSLGKKTLREEDGCRVTWEVCYEEGSLRATAGGVEDELHTARPAAMLHLNPWQADSGRGETISIPADGESICQVEISLLDEDNQLALDERVHCQVIGDLTLMGLENGRPDDLTPYTENSRETLDGRAIAYLRAGRMAGAAECHVWTAGGLHTVLHIQCTKCVKK